ncbi:MAG: branched-chain amino acid transaminase, partial [Nanoarchaeota archaeon]
MQATDVIWMDGAFVAWDDAKVHVISHALHYASGVFEGIRFYETPEGPAIFRLQEHIDRLFVSAKKIGMQIPFTREQLVRATVELIAKNKVGSGYIRPIAFFGYGGMGLTPKGAAINVAIACWPWPAFLGDKPIKVKTSSFIRIHPKSTHADAKITGHYINSLLAAQEAHAEGYDEALLLDWEGFVAEGPGENVFAVKDGVLYTPPLGAILPGITRDSVITIARDLGIEVRQMTLTPQDLRNAEELFFTGTAVEVAPIG